MSSKKGLLAEPFLSQNFSLKTIGASCMGATRGVQWLRDSQRFWEGTYLELFGACPSF